MGDGGHGIFVSRYSEFSSRRGKGMDGGKEGRNPVSGGGGGGCELQMSHTPFRTSFSSITVDVVGMELRVKERKEGRE